MSTSNFVQKLVSVAKTDNNNSKVNVLATRNKTDNVKPICSS